jgi:DMSO reductase anchor subunit
VAKQPSNPELWAAVWTLRLFFAVMLAAGGLALLSQNYRLAASAGGCLLMIAVLHHFARRLALGWIVDINGERQKILHIKNGNAFYKPTSRAQRLVEELDMARIRRRDFLVYGPVTALCGWLCWQAWTHWSSNLWPPLGIPAVVIGPFAGLLFAITLITEIAYQLGYQDMKGAKVLDPVPTAPGLQDVIQQKVHGDAQVAGPEEALDLLNNEN